MRIALIAAMMAALALGPTRADEAPDCKSQSLDMVQLDACAGIAFKAADAALNKLYGQMIAKYDAPNQALLKSAERAWLAYRDAECTFDTNLSSGLFNSMKYTQCRTAKTLARIKELDGQFHCPEGHTDCNAPE